MSEDMEQTKLLRDILKWIKFTGMKQVRETLTAILDSDDKRLAYHLSDGKKTARDIEKITKLGKAKVQNLWKECYLAGLGEQIPTQGGGSRFSKSFELKDFGIRVPGVAEEDPNSETVVNDV
ncbi:MAG: hypothetical protein WAO91_02405 [Candidatus Nitrosotenuis sp.]